MKKNSIFSEGKLLYRLFPIIFFLISLFYCAQSAPAPVSGDYRSKAQSTSAVGPFLWTTASNWETYDGTNWNTATKYPGDGTTATTQATYNVFIMPGTQINVNANARYYFGDLYILADNPVENVEPSISSGPQVGRINLSGANSGIDFLLLGSKQDVFIYGGVLYFETNSTVLGLLNGNSLVVTNYNGNNTKLGSNGLQPLQTGCTGNKQVIFYNSNGSVARNYMVCNGNNSDYNFVAVNNNGGSISAILSATPYQLCTGQTSTLITNYSGSVPNGKTIDYTLKLDSGPAGYNFTTLTGSFIDPGTAASIPDPSLGILTIPGTYVFSLTVSYPYDATYFLTSTAQVAINVQPAGAANCACYKDAATDLSRKFPTRLGISSFNRSSSDSASPADSWPNGREGGHMVIESQTAGFVINRVANTNAIAIPVEGMMIFDLSDSKLKIYTLKNGDAAPAWHVFSTPACPTL